MSYALSIICPPEGDAAYGKAKIYTPISAAQVMSTVARTAQREVGLSPSAAQKLSTSMLKAGQGVALPRAGSGWMFRLDPASCAPHPCPCCFRVVLPSDHAHAGHEDALCEGCYTWDRGVKGCLPESTAHAAGKGAGRPS